MRLTPYGRREWITISLIAMAIAGAFAWLAWWWAIFPVSLVWLALASFFRDPHRAVPPNLPLGVMLSPADGTVSAIERVDLHEAVEGPAVIVRVFLSVLNVHVNRSPCDGQVVSITHRPGRYLDARTAESAQVNESNLVVLRDDTGRLVGVRQVSGKIARRIVCPLKVGDSLRRGQRFGMIKFGSTTELILPDPDSVTVHVAVREPVRGGRTQLATMVRAAAASPMPASPAPG